jgi:hypothetical protein
VFVLAVAVLLVGQLMAGTTPAGQLLRTARFFLPAISDVAVE